MSLLPTKAPGWASVPARGSAASGSAALMENFGLFAGAYHLLRGHYSYGIPTLIVLEYRGDAGDQEFFAESGEMTEPLLAACG